MVNQPDIQNLDFRGLESKNITKLTPTNSRLIVLGIIALGLILIFTDQSNKTATRIGIGTLGFALIIGLILRFMFKIRII
jgi:uncharacterized membrane protein YczE